MSSGGDDDLSSSSSLRAQQYGLIRSLQNGQQQQGNRTGKMDNNLSAHHHLLYPHPSNHTLIHGTRNVHHTGNVNPHHHHTLTKNVHNNKMLYNDDPSPAYHHYEEPSTGSTTTGSGGNNGGLSDEPATASTCLVSRTQSGMLPFPLFAYFDMDFSHISWSQRLGGLDTIFLAFHFHVRIDQVSGQLPLFPSTPYSHLHLMLCEGENYQSLLLIVQVVP